MDNDTQLLIVDNNVDDIHRQDDVELILTKSTDQVNCSRQSSLQQGANDVNRSESVDINVEVNRHGDDDHEEHRHRREYDDFTTIDWVRDRTKYRKRHRSLKVNERKGWWDWVISSHDAWSGKS